LYINWTDFSNQVTWFQLATAQNSAYWPRNHCIMHVFQAFSSTFWVDHVMAHYFYYT